MSGAYVGDPQSGFLGSPGGGYVADPAGGPFPTPSTGQIGTTGTYNFNPALSEIAIDAFERCGIAVPSLTDQTGRIQSARRSMNFIQASWANRGVNLFTVQEIAQFMPQGVIQYFDDASCINILPMSIVLRQYLMGAPASVTPSFSTVTGSSVVTISGFSQTPTLGGYINVGVAVSVGGIIVDGFYPVQSIPASGVATILTSQTATATITNSGAVPVFAMTAGSNVVTVTFANHSLLAGQSFTVEYPTAIGGGQLLGPYTVLANNLTATSFQFLASFAAGFNTNVGENGGNTLLAAQSSPTGFASNPDDIVLYPISRDEYMAIPNKNQQARPTSVWIDRQTVPVINVWPVPDANGPYELRYRRSRQLQDADLINGVQLGAPFRFLEAFTSELAARLAVKFAPDRAQGLAQIAASEWELAASEDREKISTWLVPNFADYYG